MLDFSPLLFAILGTTLIYIALFAFLRFLSGASSKSSGSRLVPVIHWKQKKIQMFTLAAYVLTLVSIVIIYVHRSD